MKKLVVQIYEIQTPAEAEAMLKLGVDHIGSVILSESDWKKTEIRDTVRVTQQSGARSSLIPLFSNRETVCRLLDYYHPDIIHFCDTLPKSDGDDKGRIERLLRLQAELKEQYSDVKIMRSVPISPNGGDYPSLAMAERFAPVSDYFLTDTLLSAADEAHDDDQPVQGFVGITGQPCSWETAAELVRTSRIPVILAGGISPENVADGIRKTFPAGVDSCTRTNAVDSDGRPIRFLKDRRKVAELVKKVRQVEKEIPS